MSTSTRYDTIASQLTHALPDLRPRLADPLTCALVGISQAVSSQQRAVASAMPLPTQQASKIQRFRRLLDNPKLTPEAIYQPIARQALIGLRHQRVNVIIDRVVLTNHLNVLVVSVGFRRRSVALVWRVLDHQGSSSLTDQQTVLDEAIALLPPDVRVTVHGDSEFRSQALFAWICAHGWHAIMGIRGQVHVTTDPAQAGRPVQHWVSDRETVVYLNTIWITDECCGPVNVIAWWDNDEDGKRTCYAVMTDLPATWQTYRWGSRRMWIETMFRDWQSGGFELGDTAITNHDRFHRLLVLVCLVYLWFVSIGRWIVKRGYRDLLDAGPSNAWQLSLFTLAVAWQNRCRTFDQPMAIRWFLYL